MDGDEDVRRGPPAQEEAMTKTTVVDHGNGRGMTTTRAQPSMRVARAALALGLFGLVAAPGCASNPGSTHPSPSPPPPPAPPATAAQLCACFATQANSDWNEQGTQLQGTGVAGPQASCGSAPIPNHFFSIRSFSLIGMSTGNGHPVSGVTVSQGQLHGTDWTTNAPLALADWKDVTLQANVDCGSAGASSVPLAARITGTLAYDLAQLPPGPGLTGTAGLYAVEFLDPRTKQWTSVCQTPSDMAIPSGEVWDATATRGASAVGFTFACVSAVIAKCYTWGYVPWAPAKGVADPAGLHQACTRMGRADYCGTGSANTVNGHAIDVWDAFGVQKMAPAGTATLEAAWSPKGAICENHYRLADINDQPGCQPSMAPCATANPCASTSAGMLVCDASVPPL
jgi:hypothetical protein